jgi:hypothetical protein
MYQNGYVTVKVHKTSAKVAVLLHALQPAGVIMFLIAAIAGPPVRPSLLRVADERLAHLTRVAGLRSGWLCSNSISS